MTRTNQNIGSSTNIQLPNEFIIGRLVSVQETFTICICHSTNLGKIFYVKNRKVSHHSPADTLIFIFTGFLSKILNLKFMLA